MVFWWNRRKRFYRPRYTRWRKTYRRYRKPRRRFHRRRNRRFTSRRRRRRRTKVKKKKKFLRLLQWQPDSIRKCKIKGVDVIVLGANGTQHRNYTTTENEWTYPRTPGGGGFGTTIFSLASLYEQYLLRKNIWTVSNSTYDLCRYTGCKIQFFRHPWADFIVQAVLMYPMTLSFVDYMNIQPMQMILSQKHIVIPSLQNQKYKKKYITKKFKPPKQMVNKWFFQESFAPKPLLLLKSTVCSLDAPFLGQSGENELITLTCLNLQNVYIDTAWGQAQTASPYNPITTYHGETVTYKVGSQEKTMSLTGSRVNYTGGWFSKELLTATSIRPNTAGPFQYPTYPVRYNPKLDNGEGNVIWLQATTNHAIQEPTSDKIIIARDQPLWLLLFGFIDYVRYLKKGTEVLEIYSLIIRTRFFQPQQKIPPINTYLIIDNTFKTGKGPYESQVTDWMTTHWYPCLLHQQKSICSIVQAGPYAYKPDPTQANWELHIKYSFFFKWGGAQDNNKQITDPETKTTWPTPNPIQQRVQITDPQLQIPESMLHSWDFRRDIITKTALKRMYEHLPTELLISTDSEEQVPHKKLRVNTQMPQLLQEETEEKACLQSLCEENICQETEEEEPQSLKQLILQQKQQQQFIKQKLLILLSDLKKKQLQLQLHSGLIE
nr:MAG: ORF1 [Torque teno midi virus]